ncbi:hypothetical protein AB1Y20_005531 [Prymnesium parvum]|uniref:Right handed beta helix domain-containing protein n=1 Tax=Prymnesium parvum TaxID=97485 RepID=A0AB34J4J1_PRYPA
MAGLSPQVPRLPHCRWGAARGVCIEVPLDRLDGASARLPPHHGARELGGASSSLCAPWCEPHNLSWASKCLGFTHCAACPPCAPPAPTPPPSAPPPPTHAFPTPKGPNGAAEWLSAALRRAIRDGEAHFLVPAQNYRFSDTVLLVRGATDLVLEVEPGATFEFFATGRSGGVAFLDCSNVHVRGNGLRLIPEAPFYAQGLVTRVHGSWFEADFDHAFLPPDNDAEPLSSTWSRVAFWDTATGAIHNVGNQFVTQSTYLGEAGANRSTWRIEVGNWNGWKGVQRAARGRTVTISASCAGLHAWSLQRCSQVHTSGVTVQFSACFGFIETGGAGGNTYTGLKISPFAGGMLATLADGFHSASATRGPTLQDSELSSTGDDFLNVHGHMTFVCALWGAEILTATLLYHEPSHGVAQPGEEFGLYDLSRARLGTLRVNRTALAADSEIDACQRAIRVATAPPYRIDGVLSRSAARMTIHHIWLMDPLPAAALSAPFAFVNFPVFANTGAIIRRNRFSHGFARMMLLESSHTAVYDNIIANARGVHVLGDVLWLEGALNLFDVSLRNNSIQYPLTHSSPIISSAALTSISFTIISSAALTSISSPIISSAALTTSPSPIISSAALSSTFADAPAPSDPSSAPPCISMSALSSALATAIAAGALATAIATAIATARSAAC